MTAYDDHMPHVEEMIIGGATDSQRTAWKVSVVNECDCPDCPVGFHHYDAFNRGGHKGWYETREEAEAVARGLL